MQIAMSLVILGNDLNKGKYTKSRLLLRVNLENNVTFDFIINLPVLDFVGKYSLKIKILGKYLHRSFVYAY